MDSYNNIINSLEMKNFININEIEFINNMKNNMKEMINVSNSKVNIKNNELQDIEKITAQDINTLYIEDDISFSTHTEVEALKELILQCKREYGINIKLPNTEKFIPSNRNIDEFIILSKTCILNSLVKRINEISKQKINIIISKKNTQITTNEDFLSPTFN